MKSIALLCACFFFSGPALSQKIEPMRSVFETLAVKFSVVVPADCDENFDRSCSPDGSGVILGVTGDTALIATAAHVIDPLYSAGPPDLAELTLDWPNRPQSCSNTLRPKAIWRPNAIETSADDISFVAVHIQCAAPLDIVTNAWRNGTTSYGVTMFFIDLYSPFGPRHLSSPFFLSDACIRSRSCYDGGLVRTQGRIMSKRSGSAVFSIGGLVGLAIETDTLIASPRINAVLDACASGRCQSDGADIPLAPWVELFAATLEPARPYVEEGLAEDMGYVTTFLDGLPPERQDQTRQSGCITDEQVTRVRIEFADGLVLVHEDAGIDRSNCTRWPDLSGREQTTCSARVDQVDPAIELWSGPSMRLNCLSGDCFSCDRRYDATLDGHPDIADRKTFTIDYASFPVSDRSYFFAGALSPIPEREDELEDFGRAFARILSGGSHKTFCEKNFLDC